MHTYAYTEYLRTVAMLERTKVEMVVSLLHVNHCMLYYLQYELFYIKSNWTVLRNQCFHCSLLYLFVWAETTRAWSRDGNSSVRRFWKNEAEDDDMIPDNQEFNEVVDGLAAEVVNWGNSVIWRFHVANNKFLLFGPMSGAISSNLYCPSVEYSTKYGAYLWM